MKLLAVGTMAFDSIETPFGAAERIVGGAATYIAMAASYFNQNIAVVSVIGNDFPEETLRLMKQKGINLDGVEQIKNQPSFFWRGRYHNDMNSRDTLDTQLNVLANFNPIVPSAHRSADILLLGNLTPSVQRAVIEQMTKKPALIVMDTMNFWMEVALPELLETLALVDVLTINDAEARQLSGEYSLKRAAAAIQTMGPGTVIIKKGEHGALLFQGPRLFHIPALPLDEVFDPTGAGDTFAGGLVGHLSATGDLSFEGMKRAMVYASAMASFCVEKFGTEALHNLSKAEIDARAQQFIDLATLD